MLNILLAFFAVVQIATIGFFALPDTPDTKDDGLGAVKALQTAQGGTGTTTIPTTGQVLVGQSNGTYAPQATSTLGITGGSGSLSGGSPNTLTYWTSGTAVGATSSPTVGFVTSTSTTASQLPYASSTAATVSERLYVGDGNSTVPGIAFTNDQDTGIYRAASNALSFMAAGNVAIWNGDALYPLTNNARDLGRSGNKWANLYATRGTIDYASSTVTSGDALCIGTDCRTSWPVSGGSPTWGSITGTLSSQTDLQTALDGKIDTSTTSLSRLVSFGSSSATTTALGHLAVTGILGIGGDFIDSLKDIFSLDSEVTVCADASCDYVTDGTADDVQIQAAIDSVGAGGKVRILDGTYAISAPLVINDSGIVIEGEGWTTTLSLDASVNDSMLKVTSGTLLSGIEIRNMTLDGNRASQSGGDCITASSTVSSIFTELHLKECYNRVLLLSGVSGGAIGHNNIISHNLMDEGGLIGIEFNASDENQVFANTINNFDTYHIYERSGLQNISGNTFTGTASQNAIGIYQQYSSNNVIENNIFDGVGKEAIKVEGSNSIISGNRIYKAVSAGGTAAVVIKTGSNNVVSHNSVSMDDGIGAYTYAYLEDNNPSRTTVVGNVFNAGSSGAWSIGSAASSTFTDNIATTTPGNGAYWTQVDENGTYTTNVPTLASLDFSINGTSALFLSTTGSVGVGAIPPSWWNGPGDMYVNGGIRAGSFSAGDNSPFTWGDSNEKIVGNNSLGLALFAGGTEYLTVRDNGNVGIGTTSPYSKLSVAGQVVAANYVATSTTATSTLPQLTGSYISGFNLSTCDPTTGKLTYANGLFGCGTDAGGSGTSLLTNSGSNTFLNTGSNLQSPTFQSTSTTATSTLPWLTSARLAITEIFQVLTNLIVCQSTTCTYAGTHDMSAATVKQHAYKSVTWPGFATTTAATTSVPIGQAMVSTNLEYATCRVTSGTGSYQFSDGTNKTDYRAASTTASRYTFTTNDTFTVDENMVLEVGALTAAQITCGVDLIQN